MSQTMNTERSSEGPDIGSLVLGTAFTLASLILLPAIAQSLGLGPSLTSAMRIVLMKAAAKA
jgi:hypothetical protein